MSKTQNLEFSFRQRFGKINWDQILNIDLDHILSIGDIECLQPIIENLTYSTLDREDLETFGNSNAVKVFKLSQLAIEYLMYIQNHSQETGNFYISKQQKLYSENYQLKETIQSYTSEIELLKSEYFEKRKKIKIQEAVFKQPGVAAKLNKTVSRENAVSCSNCSKLFTNTENLERHKKRRHTVNDSMESNKTDISMVVEMMKTFTEQKILLVSEMNKKGVESLKEMIRLQMQVQNEKESQLFSQILTMLKNQQTLMQEEKYKSLVMELKFEKEKLSEDFEENIRIASDGESRLRGILEEREILKRALEEEEKKFEEIDYADLQDREDDRVLEVRREKVTRHHHQTLTKDYEVENKEKIDRNVLTVDYEVKYSESELNYRKESEKISKKKSKKVKKGQVEIIKTVHIENEDNYEVTLSNNEEQVEIVRTVNIEDEDRYEIPVLKNEIVYPSRVIESNAGELESDSESDDRTKTVSNCGDIVSDSQGSEIESFVEVKNDRSSVWSRPPEDSKTNEYDSASFVSEKSQTIYPKALNDEEIAKKLGMNLKHHKRYMYLIEKFHRAPLPEPWTEHVQENGVYYINAQGEVIIENPKISYFAELFRSIKEEHYKLSDKILSLNTESEFYGMKVACHYKHDLDFFKEHREKIKEEFLDPRKKFKKGKKIRTKQLKAYVKEVELILNTIIQPTVKQHFHLEKGDQKSKDFSEGRNMWPNNQGIKLIQNKGILKEKQGVQGGSNFQEGSVLGDSHFERQTGLDESKEFVKENLIRNRAILKIQERKKKKYDFESQ